jgi:membrane associated rhomboid family serine protease
MILPIADAPNTRGHVPFVTYLLIAANIAVFLLVTVPLLSTRPTNGPELAAFVRVMGQHMTRPEELRALVHNLTAYDLWVFTHGFRPASPSLRDLLVSLFLHAGLLQLAGNMLFLWIYGDNVEHRLGAPGYLVAYLGTGVAATLLYALTVPSSPVPMIGASGAISGVLGFYFVFFPRNRVRLLCLLPPFFLQVFEVPACLLLGLYLLIDNLLPYVLARSDVGVAHGAHIGGFVAGVAAAWLLQRRAASFAPAEQACGDGDAEQAIALAGELRGQGRDAAALAVLDRVLRSRPAPRMRAAAHLLAGKILLEDQDQAASAYQQLRAADDLATEAPEVAPAARAALADIAARQKRRIGTLHRRA